VFGLVWSLELLLELFGRTDEGIPGWVLKLISSSLIAFVDELFYAFLFSALYTNPGGVYCAKLLKPSKNDI
jgi:hypothetical protein